MATNHRMTPARRAALKKAQAASAKKRRGRGKGKLASANRSNSRLKRGLKYTAIGVGVAAAAAGAGYAAHKNSQRHNKRMNAHAATFHAHQKDFAHAANSMKRAHLGLSKKRLAKAKAAHAAHGTKGTKVHVSGSGHKPKAANYHQQSRLRQHAKAGDIGMYHAGFSGGSTGKTYVTGRGRNKKKHNTQVGRTVKRKRR